MELLAQALQRYTDAQGIPPAGPYLTAIPRLGILRSDHPKPPQPLIFRPSICIVAQGAKQASFGDTRLRYRQGQALVVGVQTPSIGRVFEASPEAPCLVLAMELDLAVLRQLAARMPLASSASAARPASASAPSELDAVVVAMDDKLSDCALRLVQLLDTPEAIAIVYPLIMQELCYWLLASEQGSAIARFANIAPSAAMLDTLHFVQQHFREPLRLEALAARTQMSLSAFQRHFKTTTMLAPLQYIKQLRLLEARRLLSSSAERVEAVAYAVGYESASQFSREYTRHFGLPPRRDARL